MKKRQEVVFSSAHQANDQAVLAAYGFGEKMSEAEIVAALFKMYQEKVANVAK